jgi:hypothetical protein
MKGEKKEHSGDLPPIYTLGKKEEENRHSCPLMT